MDILKSFIINWLGTPYKHTGRDKDGVDCWGLVYRYFDYIGLRINYDIDYEKHWSKNGKNYFIEGIDQFYKYFEKISYPEKGSIVLFTGINGVVNHIGIVIDDNKFIHAVKKAGVCISKFSDNRFKNKIYAFYRIKQ